MQKRPVLPCPGEEWGVVGQQLGQLWLQRQAHHEHQAYTLTLWWHQVWHQDHHIGKASLITVLYSAGDDLTQCLIRLCQELSVITIVITLQLHLCSMAEEPPLIIVSLTGKRAVQGQHQKLIAWHSCRDRTNAFQRQFAAQWHMLVVLGFGHFRGQQDPGPAPPHPQRHGPSAGGPPGWLVAQPLPWGAWGSWHHYWGDGLACVTMATGRWGASAGAAGRQPWQHAGRAAQQQPFQHWQLCSGWPEVVIRLLVLKPN